jgi:hypothetical protein
MPRIRMYVFLSFGQMAPGPAGKKKNYVIQIDRTDERKLA